MRSELGRPYPRVRTEDALSYGGSQTWFADGNFRACGCGVVACADTLLYLDGRAELPREEYIRYVNSLRRCFPLIPGCGIDGLRLALGMNACLRERGVSLRARWCASGKRFWKRLSEQLARDLPVIVAIGPSFPRVWSRQRLPLYRKTEDGFVESERTKAHFLSVTGLDEQWMRVSSWGRELYIERAAYEDYMRAQGAMFTNLLYLEQKKGG